MRSSFRHIRLQRAFTLTEMMVAVAITALLVILMTQITGAFLDYWPKAEGKLKKNMDARMVLELMAQDLQSAFLRGQEKPASYEWLQWRYDTNVLPKTIYQSSDAGMLMFFTSPSDRDLSRPGNVCAVNYRLSYENPLNLANNEKVFALYRTLASSQTTFDSILGQTNLYDGYWKNQNSLSSSNFLIANVLDLSLTFQVVQTSGARIQLPVRTALRVGPTLQAIYPSISTPPGPLQPGDRLEAIDIALTITTKQGSQRITEGHSNIEGLIKPTVDTYTRRVKMLR